jgi:hypothetical protein
VSQWGLGPSYGGLLTGGEASARQFAAKNSSVVAHLRSPLLMIVGALMLAWPAFYNGYPLATFDTGGYLATAWLGSHQPENRSVFYGLSIAPLLALHSEWPIVLAQAGIAAAMISLVLRVVTGQLRAGQYLLVILLLALLTGFSWHIGNIMADMFAGLLPLGFFLLAFARDRLALWERVFVFAVMCLSALVHFSHLPLAAALAVVVACILLWERRPRRDVLVGTTCCFAVAVVAICAQLALHWFVSDKPLTAAGGGPVFLLARLVEDGPAKEYLIEHCPVTKFALCGYVDDMPMPTVHFLWSADGPVRRLGGFNVLSDEAETIVRGTLREQPARIAWLSLLHSVQQLKSFGMEPYIDAYKSGVRDWDKTAALMQQHLPATEFAEFLRSRQTTGQIGLHRLFQLQVAIVIVSVVLLVAMYFATKAFSSDRRLRELLWLFAATLIVNAVVCGALSEPQDRYQSRIIWLLPLVLTLAAIELMNARRRQQATAP